MFEEIARFITNSIDVLGYPAIFVLMTAESALVPIPSEITMPFAGFLVGLGKLNFYVVVLVGALANLTGSLLAYALGFYAQESVVHRLVEKYGKYLLITLEEVKRSEHWFQKHGGKIAFFSRLIPVVRTFVSLPAGMAKMDIWRFAIYTFLGSLFWSTFLAYLGLQLGKNWSVLESYFRKFDILIAFIVLGLVGFYVFHKVQKIKRAS